jgi:DNA-binding NtrC family response regulator/pSer/pThr/pTyr-binding forkhead associated (FHA) protein
MNPRIVVASGSLKGRVFPVTDVPLTIGRAADNQIGLDDELASRQHCTIQLADGEVWLQDGDTPNGTWINGRAHSRKRLQHGDRIKAGSATLVYFELEESLDELLITIDDEADRNRQLDTLRADYTVRGEAAVHYKAMMKVLMEMISSIDAIADPRAFQFRLLHLMFEMTPASRGVIALNGPRVSPEPGDFISQVYGERSVDDPTSFPLSSKILGEVYATRSVVMSNSGVPVLCAPLLVSNAIRGIVYLEGTGRHGFEPEHLSYLKAVAGIAAAGIRRAIEFKSIRDENNLHREIHADDDIIGESAPMQKLRQLILLAAAEDVAVLILGETGTGKEMVARAIHRLSARVKSPYVVINCAGMVDELLPSELFGHVKGAYTGAADVRKGKLRLADGGTVFLDEIGEMTMDMQKRLLRVLQEKQFEPVGGDHTFEVDVRVIAATNVDLEEAVRQKTFRDDLWYRLNVFLIQMPALRDRSEDIPLLADHFAQKYGARRGISGFTPEAMEALMGHDWPGNIRELENVIQSAIIHARSGEIGVEHLPENLARKAFTKSLDGSLKEKGLLASQETKRVLLERRIQENGGDVDEAAKWAHLSRSWAYKLLKRKPPS